MQTKYDVGQTVLLKVKVSDIIINDDGITYSIIMTGKKNTVKVPETDIEGVVEEITDGD